MSQPYVAGLDTGLVCTGLATCGRTAETARIGVGGVTKLPLAERTRAIVSLGGRIRERLYVAGRPDLVVMEAPDTSSSFGGLIERIQLYHELAREFVESGVALAIVPSGILKGYATGNGGVDPKKKRVMSAVMSTWPEYGEVNDDEADAVVLAAMGLDWLTGQRRVSDGRSAGWLKRSSIQWPPDIPNWPRIRHTV